MSWKGPRPAEFSAIRNLLGYFSIFFGDTLVLQMGDTVHVGPRYTAPKISAISYLFRTFSLLIMGDTERPRYTGFRGLSVRGITALQCICQISQSYPKQFFRYFVHKVVPIQNACVWKRWISQPKIFRIGSKIYQFIYTLVWNYMPNIRILAKVVPQLFCSQGCSYTKCMCLKGE